MHEKNDKFQVLCATMHQVDFSKFESMNIQSDILYANQSDSVWYKCKTIGNHFAEMITTKTRGLSNNRNILLLHASADICLLSDDDIEYYTGYREKILKAFAQYQDADMIIFNMDGNSEDRPVEKISKQREMHFYDKNPYGSVRIAFRLNSQRKFNIWFNNLLGAGSKYGSGEDTLFINEFRKKGKVYLHDANLGIIDFSNSTWFFGYTEKFFFNQGAKVRAMCKRGKLLWFLYYALRMRNSNVPFFYRIKLMNNGYSEYRDL